MKRIPIEALERVARLYKTNTEASASLGMTMRGFARACRRHGIETPYARQQRTGAATQARRISN